MKLNKLCNSISITVDKNKQNLIFLNTSDVLNGKILHCNYSIREDLPGQAKKSIKNDDILYSEIRPQNCRFAYVSVQNPNDYIVSTKLMVIRRCNELIIPKYLYLYLTSPKIINHLQELAESRSGTFPQITFDEIKSLEINLPSIEEQQHIIDTIGSIDDLIENNNTIIIKLENIILNLYRKKSIEWKKQVKIGDLFKCILGGTPSTKKNEYWDGDIAWVNSGEVNKLRIVSPSRYITKDGLENSATKLLPKKTTVIAITGATLGQVSLLEIDSCTNQSVIGILENNTLKHDFIYPMMINAIKKLVLNKTGGAQQHINKNDVETFEIFVPSEIEYFEYSQIVQPIFEYQSKLILQNKELLLLKNKYLQKFFG